MRIALCLAALAVLAPGRAETNTERGKRVVEEAVAALGGDRFLTMRDRSQAGRAYSFYREEVSGLSIARIFVRYLSGVTDTANTLAIEEREYFGKKEDFGILFTTSEAYDVTFRGARPLAGDRFARYKETTLRDILYMLRVRLHEPGMMFESRGADVLDNRAVEIVDVTDAQNRLTTVYFDRIEKMPVRQVFFRRDPVTREKDQEITEYTKYRDVGGGVKWPFDIHRERNGEKIYEIFCDSADVNKNYPDKHFRLPGDLKLLKPQ